MANHRLYYACLQPAFSKNSATEDFIAAHGVQSVGITTTFNLEPVFELGQLNIYENLEQIPEIEITMEKVLDGHPLLYHLATNGSVNSSIAGRQYAECEPGLGVFQDTVEHAGGSGVTPIAVVHCPRSVVNSVTYTFPVDGFFTESISLSSNQKLWKNIEGGDTLATFTGAFTDGLDAPVSHVQQRQNLIWDPAWDADSPSGTDENGASKANCTVLPKDIYGTTSAGLNPKAVDGTENWVVPVQNITVSVDFNRTSVNELGKRTYYLRYVNFPVDVRTEIEVLATKWDGISAIEAGGQNGAPTGYNLKQQTIRVQSEEGTLIDLGTRNKLSSVAMSGGDATSGGSNVMNRYTYVNQNYLVVTHPADPSFPPEEPETPDRERPLDDYQIEYHIHRLTSGLTTLKVGGRRYLLKLKPPALAYILAAEIREEERRRGLEAELLTREQAVEELVARGLWSDEEEHCRLGLPDTLRKTQVDYYNSRADEERRDAHRKILAGVRNQMGSLEARRSTMDGCTIENLIAQAHHRFLLGCSLEFPDGTPYWRDPDHDWHRSDSIIDQARIQYEQDMLSVSELRTMARDPSWTSIWRRRETAAGLLRLPASELSDELTTLLHWTEFYDALRGCDDCPEDEVFEDDDLFDGWLQVRAELAEEERNRPKGTTRMSRRDVYRGRIAHAGEQFITARPEIGRTAHVAIKQSSELMAQSPEAAKYKNENLAYLKSEEAKHIASLTRSKSLPEEFMPNVIRDNKWDGERMKERALNSIKNGAS